MDARCAVTFFARYADSPAWLLFHLLETWVSLYKACAVSSAVIKHHPTYGNRTPPVNFHFAKCRTEWHVDDLNFLTLARLLVRGAP